jgi:type IV secretory pathway TrbF-like protein
MELMLAPWLLVVDGGGGEGAVMYGASKWQSSRAVAGGHMVVGEGGLTWTSTQSVAVEAVFQVDTYQFLSPAHRCEQDAEPNNDTKSV